LNEWTPLLANTTAPERRALCRLGGVEEVKKEKLEKEGIQERGHFQ
jgi:hypothetical protein